MRCVYCVILLVTGAVVMADEPEVSPTYSNGQVTLSCRTPRPVWKIVRYLREEYSWRINYEDPPSSYEGDYVDTTAPTYHSKGPWDRALEPRAGLIQIHYAAAAEGQSPGRPGPVLNELLEVYANAGLPGRFVLRQRGDEYDVVPISMADQQGRWGPVKSILDATVTITKKDRAIDELLNELRNQLSAIAGTRVLLDAPPNVHERLDEGFENSQAREVIRAALARMPRPWAWDLTYAPGLYVLNIAPVGRR